MGSLGFGLLFQPSQPILSVLHLSNTRISVFPEGEEFLVVLNGPILLAQWRLENLGALLNRTTCDCSHIIHHVELLHTKITESWMTRHLGSKWPFEIGLH